MTKERRLAVQMWEEIKEAIRKVKRPSDVDVSFIWHIKLNFMTENNLDWMHGCWFCQYVRYYDTIHGEGCQRCPLSDGSADAGCSDNVFATVLDARMRKTKLKACDEIIATLKGEIYGKRKSASSNGRSVRRNDTSN